MLKRIMIVVAVAILIGALAYSNMAAEKDELLYMKQILPQTNFEKISNNPPTFKTDQSNGKEHYYVVFGEANGYGGPMKVAAVIDPLGEIQQVVVVESRETPSFLNKVLKAKFLDQFKNIKANDPIELGADIDYVTGATVSSRAIANAVRQGSHEVAVNQLGLSISEKPESWKFGLAEASAIILLLAVWVLSLVWKKSKMRYITLLAAVIIFGFWLKIQISLSSISALLMGYWPSIHSNMIWYVIVLGGLGIALFSGRNLYCYWLCPFGGVQELTSMVRGRSKCRRVSNQLLKLLPKILLWSGLLLTFLYRNPAIGSYEPFGTLFGLTGTFLNWLLLLVIMTGSIFIYRFWCDCFCPVGAFLDICAKIRRRLGKLVHLPEKVTQHQMPMNKNE
ncbi:MULTISPECIES: FMN-binding protein [unclassified Dehalobacter]|uniref:FMN-binding protein n=1 Tax=unclassified Dehalobacter TaxID=2635733 RepID=UPI00028B6FE4|nr:MULTISPECIES: FMN-binding protein [unclassified Dehalobacter]AFV02168.1 Putative membrane bound regulatory protein (PceC like) [Dehalobacter sp. DCA]AFV05213.1 Putative membrane bound regulatory protein (PceC like) [Dehalobacter sp. CF]